MDSVAPSQLVFPRAVDSLQADRGAIRGQLRDTYNRLHSIAHDAAFIHDEVAQAYPDFPVVANQRAGAWYVKPSDEKAHAYFKSTDGHANEHNFNLRRANLALLPLVKHRQGIVFVDSTRRGKRFPDALSKTIPLWCATLNRARVLLLPPAPDNSSVTVEEWQRQGCLYTSPQAVGRSEHAQIEEKIEGWAQDLASSAYDLSALKALDRPLRPFFVSPASTLTPSPASSFPTCYAVICASASKLAEEADGLERALGFTYVQGSGDDHEAWSKGLTPPVFWQHADEILGASREEIDCVIERILATSSLAALNIADPASSSTPSSTQIRSTNLYLRFAASSAGSAADDTTLITVSASKAPPLTDSTPSPTSLSAKPGKAGYNSFFSPAYLEPALELATDKLSQGSKVCVSVLAGEAQSEANDLGVAVALILLARLYDEDGQLLDSAAPPPVVSKDRIRIRLQWVLEAFPTVNPSRAVLNRVNEFAMSKRR
ncbi:tRNA A64-2'-O-ribosylphosphate transferase [Rhodotorula paludigena]|uniref:tRNA A64-2'-O-ribosylphosphate transferase n=1 Tax=Rhodotorula paludigena TaxID=86838 RepID=UPI003178878C